MRTDTKVIINCFANKLGQLVHDTWEDFTYKPKPGEFKIARVRREMRNLSDEFWASLPEDVKERLGKLNSSVERESK